jgi:hypothetical protein
LRSQAEDQAELAAAKTDAKGRPSIWKPRAAAWPTELT